MSLSSGLGTGGDAEGDTLVDFENLEGSSKNDRLEGNSGNNVLIGGDGDDVIDGAGGDDVLVGGEGADKFLFGSEFHFAPSDVTISDFEAGEDTIDVSHLDNIENYDDVSNNMTQVGDDVVFNYEGSSITFENTDLSNSSETDFVFG